MYNTDMPETITPTFVELMARAKRGDRDAFGLLYESHLTPVYRYAVIRVGRKEDAEDIAQETFIRAYKALDRFEVTTDDFLPYLFTIARNLIINHTKKKQPEFRETEDIDQSGSALRADGDALHQERTRDIGILMESLSDMEREVIELRFFGERTYVEIAAILDKREDAVRQHIARALRKMRQHPLISQLS